MTILSSLFSLGLVLGSMPPAPSLPSWPLLLSLRCLLPRHLALGSRHSALGSRHSALGSWLSAAASPTRVAPLCCLACFRRAAFRCCRFAIFFHRVAADCVDSRRAAWALCSRVDFRRAASEDRRIVDRKLQSSLPCLEVGSAADPRLGVGLTSMLY